MAASPTVLVVEDEDLVRANISRFLQSQGYRTVEAPHGAAALQLLQEQGPDEVALILTDLRMPVMDGRSLAAALARLRPSLPIVFMSGYTTQLADLQRVFPDLVFLAKPFSHGELLATVKAQLKSPSST